MPEEIVGQEVQVEEPVESTPTEETQASEEVIDSEVADLEVANTTTEEVQRQTVPYDRLQEVIQERNFLREQLQRSQPQAQQVQQQVEPEIPQHLIDEDGEVDPIGYQNWVRQSAVEEARQAARQEYQSQRAFENAWTDAETAYPELRTDTELRGMVDAAIMGEFQRGNLITPSQMAERIFSRFKATEANAIKKAQISTTRQAQSGLEVNQSQVQVDEGAKLYDNALQGDVKDFIKSII
jgi:hypothetical protein